MFWGLSEALNLIKLLRDNDIYSDDKNTVNILLINGCDARHIIKTIAEEYSNQEINFKFYVIENSLELIGRQILLLYLTMDFANLGPLQKVHVFMELFGNTLIRPITSKYLVQIAKQLINEITNQNRHTIPFINFKYLQYRDMDYLENQMKFWTGIGAIFNICQLWDNRLRTFLGNRYDNREGAFDWDLMMTFHDRCKRVMPQEYKHFRSTGVAFTWDSYEYSKPNLTLSCGVIDFGSKLSHCGYQGDIRSGPFVAYGFETDNKNLLETYNMTNKYRATDITEFNLMKFFYQIQYKELFPENKFNKNSTFPGLLLKRMPEQRIVDFQSLSPHEIINNESFSKPEWQNLQFDVIFLKFNMLQLKQFKDFKNLFHLVYIPYSFLNKISDDMLQNILKLHSMVVIETEKYNLRYNFSNLENHATEVNERFQQIPGMYSLKFDFKTDTFLNFVYKK